MLTTAAGPASKLSGSGRMEQPFTLRCLLSALPDALNPAGYRGTIAHPLCRRRTTS
jgi:hypothetical protein